MDPRTGGRSRSQPSKFFAGVAERLIAHAAHEFALDRPQKDGHALRTHLESAARATGRRPAELDGPPAPPEAAHLLRWFREIARSRAWAGAGRPCPLAWSEIDAWCRVRGVRLTPWETDTLKRLDNAFLESRA